jgi:hypothetical protein
MADIRIMVIRYPNTIPKNAFSVIMLASDIKNTTTISPGGVADKATIIAKRAVMVIHFLFINTPKNNLN